MVKFSTGVPDQAPATISLHLTPEHDPRIHMMTKDGLTRKIRLNGAVAGVTLGAIRSAGVDF